jgi:hypothetical protein
MAQKFALTEVAIAKVKDKAIASEILIERPS